MQTFPVKNKHVENQYNIKSCARHLIKLSPNITKISSTIIFIPSTLSEERQSEKKVVAWRYKNRFYDFINNCWTNLRGKIILTVEIAKRASATNP